MADHVPPASSPLARRRMQNTPRRDTPAELALRQELHRRGLRYRVDIRPVANLPRRADIVFRRAKVAVFCDGCYWHGCPEHATWPKHNAEWWRHKIEANWRRDRDTDAKLAAAGWSVIRVWEHEDPASAAEAIQAAVTVRRR
jgi:DNA mismatch endonuclease, patch repair protein